MKAVKNILSFPPCLSSELRVDKGLRAKGNKGELHLNKLRRYQVCLYDLGEESVGCYVYSKTGFIGHNVTGIIEEDDGTSL